MTKENFFALCCKIARIKYNNVNKYFFDLVVIGLLGFLNTIEEEAVLKLKNEFKSFLGNRLTKFILYGSKARGDFNEDSDIDILLVVDNLDLDTKEQLADIIVDMELEYMLPLSVHMRSKAHYEEQIQNRINLYMKNIQKEGIAV